MGKFIYAIIAVFVIELALYLFGGTTYAETSLFTFVLNPTTTSTFYILLYTGVVGFAAYGIIASAFGNVNIYGLYAVIVGAMITFIISIFHLASFVYGQLGDVLSIQLALVTTALIVAPFLLTYILAVLEWVRAN